jgi:SAM-dependent methyltransferase
VIDSNGNVVLENSPYEAKPWRLSDLGHSMSRSISNTPFEDLGPNYMLTDHARLSPLVMEGYDKLAKRIMGDGAARVLDWGCGFAHLTRRLIDSGIQAEAYDYIPGLGGAMSKASTRYPDLIVRLSGDPVFLPYATGAFDAVASMGTLEHVCDPVSSVSEIRRVLVPGGKLYIFRLPNRYSYVEFAARRTGRYYHGKLEHDRTYTLATVTALLETNGFTVQWSSHSDMLPLTSLGSRLGPKGLRFAKTVNSALSRVPLLSVLSTNLEVVAVRSGPE